MQFRLLSTVLTAASIVAVSAQTQTGTLFNFVPGLGACGFTNTSTQIVASVSAHTFSTFPGATPNPNNNPICTHSLKITHNNVTVTAPIVDFFTATGVDSNVGLSAAGFVKFAPLSDGIVPGVVWQIV
ncbi:hypothetical protein BXZ70DRAFT_734699 [Cristinia sonorae]|uniref:Uncharacterized protein n=1 Tax=Cristinia sonorae TaxID=1940300 RepID=A0A8K0UU36_9AGAR|nr:hypothetical protein BXZ70DRAFT_734699 [Cristinia sonorae]